MLLIIFQHLEFMYFRKITYKTGSWAGSLHLGSGLKKSERAQLNLDLIDKSAETSSLAWRGWS